VTDPGDARARLRYPKARRLRKRRDFVRVQDRSVTSGNPSRARVTTAHFILLLAPRPSAGPCRLGVVTSKKVGCAVVRNRTRRLVREAFRTRPELFPQGIDLVVIAKQGPEGLSLCAVCREIEGVASLLARKAREALRDAENSPAAMTGK
jgi:ribonuclease P protein component